MTYYFYGRILHNRLQEIKRIECMEKQLPEGLLIFNLNSLTANTFFDMLLVSLCLIVFLSYFHEVHEHFLFPARKFVLASRVCQ